MNDENRHSQAMKLLGKALNLPNDQRRDFIIQSCGDDERLKDELLKLLSDHEQADAMSGGDIPSNGEQPDVLSMPEMSADPEDIETDETLEHSGNTGDRVYRGKPGASPASVVGPDIEGYEIIREIGRGGMGVVYEAVQLKLNRRVALKVLPVLPGEANRQAVERFRREATAAAKLHHTHIVPIHDFGQSGHAHYYAMELVEGRPLSEMIRRFASANAPSAPPSVLADILGYTTAADDESDETEAPAGQASRSSGSSSFSDGSGTGGSSTGRGRVYFRQVAHWMADAADALHCAHSNGIIHRDVKPSNLMLSYNGQIMVLDFGLAKGSGDLSVTMTGSLIGTLRYMSPEQAMAKRMKIDHRTDIYSLGATMYELLTLQPAFQGGDDKEILGQIITREPTPPRKRLSNVPRELETICIKTLEKDANARYATAKDFADDLRRYSQDLPIVARPVGPVGRVIKFVRRRRAMSVAIVSIVLLAVSVTFAVRAHQKKQEADALARIEKISNLITQGDRYLKDRNWAASEKSFEAALKLDPNSFETLFNFARLRWQQFNHTHDETMLTEADRLFGRALEVQPNRIEVWNARGVMLRMGGRYQDAIEIHERGGEINPDFYANWVSLASAYAVNGDIDKIEDCLLKAVELPDGASDVMAWHNLLAIQLHLGKPEAMTTLKKLPADANRSVDCVLLKARLYLQLPGHTDLDKALRLAITADGLAGEDHPPPHVKRILALAELRNENWSGAVEAARRALEHGDGLPAYPHLIVSVAEAHLGHRSTAREHLATAQSSWPADLESAGVIATAVRGLLWFETAAELAALRAEAEAAIAAHP